MKRACWVVTERRESNLFEGPIRDWRVVAAKPRRIMPVEGKGKNDAMAEEGKEW